MACESKISAWSTRLWLAVTIVLASLVQLTTQRDPIKDFCRRFGHQTAVVDDKLYIDGGLINWNPLKQDRTNYTNSWLLYQDLNVVPEGMPQIYANLSKNASIPSVHGGTLWADELNGRLYLFGGEYEDGQPPATYNLYSYDTWYNEWHSFGQPDITGLYSVSYGAGVSVSERGEGYYYGGYISNATTAGWGGDYTPTTGIIRYTYDDNSWSNSTGPPDEIPRAEGVMVYIPAGDGGMLVYFGGIQDPYRNGTFMAQPMEQIFVFDTVSSKWYSQNATGTVPEYRRRFCAGAIWAEDRSSYNIYLYGGLGFGDEFAGFDDVYILSLPSFTWIKYYPLDREGTGDYPHHSLSCNVVSDSQMLIIGGSFPTADICDSETVWGTHNLDLGKQLAPPAIWAAYDNEMTDYQVPEDIYTVIGGDGGGGATVTAPVSGFEANDLNVLLTRTATAPDRSITEGRVDPRPTPGDEEPTTAPTDEAEGGGGGADLGTGAIAGIAVGGAVALALVAAGIFFLLRRRNKKGKGEKHASPAELPVQQHGGFDAPVSPYAQTSYAGTGSPTLLQSPQGPDGGGGYEYSQGGRNFSWTSTPTGSPPVQPASSTSPHPMGGWNQPHLQQEPAELDNHNANPVGHYPEMAAHESPGDGMKG
ncbi:Kelch repeat-containing protein-like protein 5 [Zalerion maritima]|uniref:Kelch repeat-containing protein-like protein 5 n=1 Tax=Zalerion maritima TaxID=339359 RepID=A0AAD5RRZ6_9PEZI|nr:Kelch repeat-containing protein-like protein 5 [Zalerion maritima]